MFDTEMFKTPQSSQPINIHWGRRKKEIPPVPLICGIDLLRTTMVGGAAVTRIKMPQNERSCAGGLWSGGALSLTQYSVDWIEKVQENSHSVVPLWQSRGKMALLSTREAPAISTSPLRWKYCQNKFWKLKSVVLCLNDRFFTTRQMQHHLLFFYKFTVIWEDAI